MKRLAPDIKAALERARDEIAAAHRDDPNFSGAGIGFRFRRGKWTDEPVVTVFVVKKQREVLVPPEHLLPESVDIDGKPWGVDVMQAGPFTLY